MTAQRCLFWDRAGALDSAALVIGLFRCWKDQRQRGREPMAAMMQRVEGYGYDLTLVPICDSFFALTESCVGRPLQGGPLFALTEGPKGAYHDDEQGLLALLGEGARISGTAANTAIPHGLPGALCWAIKALVRVLGADAILAVADFDQCPFAPSASKSPSAPPIAPLRIV